MKSKVVFVVLSVIGVSRVSSSFEEVSLSTIWPQNSSQNPEHCQTDSTAALSENRNLVSYSVARREEPLIIFGCPNGTRLKFLSGVIFHHEESPRPFTSNDRFLSILRRLFMLRDIFLCKPSG